MPGWIISLITGPILGKVVDAYKAKLDAGNTRDRIAADLAAQGLQLDAREAELQSQYKASLIGHWYEPMQLMGYVLVSFIAKCVVWDTMLGWGTTEPLRGQVGEWAGQIVMFYIGARTAQVTVVGVLRTIFGRR